MFISQYLLWNHRPMMMSLVGLFFCGSFLKCPLQKNALSTVHWDTTRQPISWLPCANSRCCPKEALPAAWFGGAARIRRCWRRKTMRGFEGKWGYLPKRWHWKPEQTSFNHHDQKTVYDGIIEHWMGFNILIEHRGKKSPANSANMHLLFFSRGTLHCHFWSRDGTFPTASNTFWDVIWGLFFGSKHLPRRYLIEIW